MLVLKNQFMHVIEICLGLNLLGYFCKLELIGALLNFLAFWVII